MKTKEELEEAIKGTILKYKRVDYYPKGLITIDADTPVCMPCLKELWKQQVIDKKVYDQKLIDDTWKKPAWDGLQKKYRDGWWHDDWY